MSALSLDAPRSRFNPLALTIPLFCLLWSFAFVAGKVGVTDCPPLIFLATRFLIAGVLILGISALRGDAWKWNMSRRDVVAFIIIGIANNALYLGLGYIGLRTISAGLLSVDIIINISSSFTKKLWRNMRRWSERSRRAALR